jgi:hypothetical protein
MQLKGISYNESSDKVVKSVDAFPEKNKLMLSVISKDATADDVLAFFNRDEGTSREEISTLCCIKNLHNFSSLRSLGRDLFSAWNEKLLQVVPLPHEQYDLSQPDPCPVSSDKSSIYEENNDLLSSVSPSINPS